MDTIAVFQNGSPGDSAPRHAEWGSARAADRLLACVVLMDMAVTKHSERFRPAPARWNVLRGTVYGVNGLPGATARVPAMVAFGLESGTSSKFLRNTEGNVMLKSKRPSSPATPTRAVRQTAQMDTGATGQTGRHVPSPVTEEQLSERDKWPNLQVNAATSQRA